MLKVGSMTAAARRLVAVAAGTSGGTWVYVGWNGSSIVASSKVIRSLPHRRVEIQKGDTEEIAESKLAGAVADMRGELIHALKKPRAAPRLPDNSRHLWARKGSLKRPRG